MICLVALFVFAVLGLFSAKYRQLAKEAFRCTFLRLTFKPCDSQLDQRIKSKLTSKLLPRAPGLARFIYRNFDVLSTVFTIVFFASTIYSAYSLYNLATLGTCDPSGGYCPLGATSPVCGCEGVCQCGALTCDAPDYVACAGDCQCQKSVCGMK